MNKTGDLYDKRNFRFVCFDKLQSDNKKCVDFEARFCCPRTTNLKRSIDKRSTVIDKSLWLEYMQKEPEIPGKLDELRNV